MPLKPLTIREEIAPGNGVVIFHLEGQLDTHSFEELNGCIQSHFDESRFNLLFNLTGVDYISSTCVGVFLSTLATATQNGGQVVIVNPVPKVQVVFDLFGLMQMFKVSTDLTSGLAQFP
ncbi:MAG: STAS domain-containing protein [Planctomycetota bacterium]|nr:STAS domain-containing protein [Planctomycetota bacterium]